MPEDLEILKRLIIPGRSTKPDSLTGKFYKSTKVKEVRREREGRGIKERARAARTGGERKTSF